MSRLNEISSTEKLIDVIRSKNDVEGDKKIPTHSDQPGNSRTILPPKRFILKNTVTVGVVIGYNTITMAMATWRSSGQPGKLIDYAKIPLPDGMTMTSRGFPVLLKDSLTKFFGNKKHGEIWCSIFSANVETRNIKIPKVPDKQVSTAVYWKYKKEVPFNEAEMIFDYHVIGDVTEDGIKKTEVIAYSAPKQDVNSLEKLFLNIGFPLTGISIVPFALQNLFRTGWIKTDAENVCTLYVGRSHTRIDIFSEGNLVLSRAIKTGMNSMIEAVRESTAPAPGEGAHDQERSETVPSQKEVTIDSINLHNTLSGSFKDEAGGETSQAQNIFFCMLNNSFSEVKKGMAPELDEGSVFEMIEPVLERLIKQMERTFEHFSINFGGRQIDKIYITGDAGGYEPLVTFIGRQLGIPMEKIDPFASTAYMSNNALALMSAKDRDSLTPAVGMAISNPLRTPNFIFTFKQKEILSKSRRINVISFSLFIAIIVMFICIFGWQKHVINSKKQEKARLDMMLMQSNPLATQEYILQLIAKGEYNKKIMKKYERNYLGLALIKELSDLTPENIKLIDVSAHMGDDRAETQDKAPVKTGKMDNIMILEGIVMDESLQRETALVQYLMKLNGSRIFGHASIKKKYVETYENKDVLHFIAQLELM